MNNNNFYIFLDIDGVLTNWNYALSLNNKKEIANIMSEGVCENNINALNHLIEIISNYYTPIIVITSIRRILDYDTLIFTLRNCNLKYNNEFYKTEIDHNRNRTIEIKKYISKNNINDNYIIIDDELLENDFPNKCIKTDIFNYGLTKELIDDYFAEPKLSL